jgi:hypothetical protein
MSSTSSTDALSVVGYLMPARASPRRLPYSGLQLFRLDVITTIAACMALTGCATYDLPTSAEAGLVHGSLGIVQINALSCRPDGAVVAAGIAVSGLSTRGGLILRSADQGLTWRVVHHGDSMAGVDTWFFEDPRDIEKMPRPLYATGYRNATWATAVSLAPYSMGPWLLSVDDGLTWTHSDPVAPFGSSRRLGDPDVRRAVAVDSAGTLAFAQAQRALDLFADGSVVLMRSRDGVRNWTESAVPGLAHDPYALLSDGNGRLVIVGRRGGTSNAELMVLHSDDGGDHWVESLRHPEGRQWEAAGKADGGLIVWRVDDTPGRTYFASSDGGRTWSGRSIPLWQPFRRVINVGPERWVALSVERVGEELEAVAWTSADGAATWSSARTGLRRHRKYEAMGYASTLLRLGDGILIAHAGGSRVARSPDSGRTWRLIDAGLPDRDFGLRAHCTDGKGLVVLAGAYGLATRSLDGGLTWQAGRMAERSR